MSLLTRDKEPEVVVITGASAGVGRAVVREFAKRGAAIGLIARDAERLRATRQEVEELGGRALVLPLDVADADALEAAADEVEATFGPIDVWVNNAMVTVLAPLLEMSPEDYERVTDVTYHGQVHGTMTALRRMKPRDRGTIVQVGSALAYRGIPLQSAYCGAKHAVQGFTESVRCELIHDGSNVHITMVQLPALNTPQFSWGKTTMPHHPQPVPPIFQPEVAARAIYWAAHHKRRELYVGTSAVKGIVGNKIAPRLADHYLARNGYDSQQTDHPIARDRPDNLWEPVEGDFAAHGIFDDRAKAHSPQLWLNLHRTKLLGAAFGLAAGYLLWRKLSR